MLAFNVFNGFDLTEFVLASKNLVLSNLTPTFCGNLL